jgi:hypothetical protein
MIFGFPAPIILALLLNEVRFSLFKKITQTQLYAALFLLGHSFGNRDDVSVRRTGEFHYQ